MSDYLNTIDNAPDITLGEAMEEIRALHVAGERLRRERDEARSFAAHYVKSLTDEAEARGYRKGVEDAEKVVSKSVSRILALLEQKLSDPDKPD